MHVVKPASMWRHAHVLCTPLVITTITHRSYLLLQRRLQLVARPIRPSRMLRPSILQASTQNYARTFITLKAAKPTLFIYLLVLKCILLGMLRKCHDYSKISSFQGSLMLPTDLL